MKFLSKSDKDSWETPPRILEPLNNYVGIDMDPCAGLDTNIGGYKNINPSDGNGLKEPWGIDSVDREITVFLNPPFSYKNEFIKKAIKEYNKGGIKCIYILTPDSTNVKSWWNNLIVPNCKYTWFPKGRVYYINPDTGNKEKGVSFGSALSIMGSVPSEYLEYLDSKGDLMKRGFL